uniref:TlpA family protein disulfide reductase n=1 Tax=Schlesneria paludicola TaxID=360056 RepID=A0A7C4LPI9_9PLAN
MNPCLAVVLLNIGWSAVPFGTEVHYSGTVAQSASTGRSTVKTFALSLMIVPGENAAAEMIFQVEERGGGGFAWPERFGRAPATDGQAIRILQTFEGHDYALPLRPPVFEFLDRLQPESQWSVGQHQYACVRATNRGGRDCWLVEAALDRGRRQTLHVEQASGLLVSLEERFFLGRGDPFELTLQLESTRRLSPADMERHVTAAQALLALQQQLGRGSLPRPPELTADQAALVEAALPKLQQTAVETGWRRLVETIERDLQQQKRRLLGIQGLTQKYVGQSAELPDLKLLTGATRNAADGKDQVLVLHFWEYSGDKLVEPYGQVGYLDFLHQRRHKLGVQVLGIAVDERFKDPAQRAAATRTVRKLQEFMNLSYAIALDDGTLLQAFGDPRTLGAALPLWVVIGSDGKITHYQVGYYDILPDEGLKPLDAAVIAALKQRASGK